MKDGRSWAASVSEWLSVGNGDEGEEGRGENRAESENNNTTRVRSTKEVFLCSVSVVVVCYVHFVMGGAAHVQMDRQRQKQSCFPSLPHFLHSPRPPLQSMLLPLPSG